MSEHTHTSDPQDICLLLRAHCEQRWLIYEVIPVLRQLETPDVIPEDQLGAALAYLELLWLDARRRARETDAACDMLDVDDHQHDPTLYEKARRYHAAVRRLRVAIGQHIAERTRLPGGAIGHEHAGR